MNKFLVAIPMIMLVSCGNPKASQQTQGAHAQSQVLGDTGVTISRDMSSTQEHDLTVIVGDKNIDISYHDSGFSNFDGYGATLSEDDKAALKKAAEVFAQASNLNEQSSADDQVTYKVLDYLSYAPSNYAFESNRYDKQLALKNEGITCIKKNTIVKAEWNTLAASYVTENILVGTNWPNSYGCMGRCGANCGNWLPSSWTKDCMDHDACSYRNSSSGGAADPNCGDEFTESADDWTFGVVNGCRG
ncbi:MAG: hypothetical protein M3Q07_10495 [Pseudobdellovibrionaceae bacterium]|nr:hypothetical protein [Pseudobdellovibrionaceae bacterium]